MVLIYEYTYLITHILLPYIITHICVSYMITILFLTNQVSSLAYLTTARRVSLMFVWVHVLGTGALMLPPACRTPALVMIAAMQVMVVAAQGRRSYSQREWSRLYVDTAREFFGAMEALMDFKQRNDRSETPSIFQPMRRYTYDLSYECSHMNTTYSYSYM